MRMKEWEKDLLLAFCGRQRIAGRAGLSTSLEQIRVVDRAFTDVGVFTTFARHPCLRIAGEERKDKIDGPEMLLNADKILAASLFHIDDGYISTIECYTFADNSWPEEIACYEILETR